MCLSKIFFHLLFSSIRVFSLKNRLWRDEKNLNVHGGFTPAASVHPKIR
jgi:hypothetical protein